MTKLLAYAVGCAAGIAIAAYDMTTRSDDGAQFTLAFLLASGTVAGFLSPARPWGWALAIGPWLGVSTIAAKLFGRSSPMQADTYAGGLILLAIGLAATLVGAGVGSVIRRCVAAERPVA
jgi:hypothetical protein